MRQILQESSSEAWNENKLKAYSAAIVAEQVSINSLSFTGKIHRLIKQNAMEGTLFFTAHFEGQILPPLLLCERCSLRVVCQIGNEPGAWL